MIFVQARSGSLKYTFEWADAIPANVDLISVSYQVPSYFTLVSQVTDVDNKTSTVQIAGIQNGARGVITATAQLTNSEAVPNQELQIVGLTAA